MKNFTLIACLTLGLISCSNTGYEKKILGSWCEPIPGRAQNKISERRKSQFDQYGHSSIQKLEDKRKNTHSGRRKYRQPSNLTFFRHPEYHTARQRPVDFKERSWLPNSLQKVQLRMKRTCSLNEQ